MSVMLLPYAHINVLAQESAKWAPHLFVRVNALSGALYGQGLDGRRENGLAVRRAIGKVLVQAVAQSYMARYEMTPADAEAVRAYIDSYRYERPRRDYTPAEVGMALRSFSYQACEAEDWEQGAGYAFYLLMQEHLLCRVIADADPDTWVIRDEVPAAA